MPRRAAENVVRDCLVLKSSRFSFNRTTWLGLLKQTSTRLSVASSGCALASSTHSRAMRSAVVHGKKKSRDQRMHTVQGLAPQCLHDTFSTASVYVCLSFSYHRRPQMIQDALQAAIKERHEYLRHVFTSLVSWFTIFLGWNYLALGWFAASAGTLSSSKFAIISVSALFVIQCLLGIGACCVVRKYLTHVNEQILGLQKELAETINDAPIAPVFLTDQTSIPLRVYLPSVSLMIAAVG
jgi:hypothetical protein